MPNKEKKERRGKRRTKYRYFRLEHHDLNDYLDLGLMNEMIQMRMRIAIKIMIEKNMH